MAIVHDCMPSFDLYQPTDINDALSLADRIGPDAWILAGGLDSLERFKDRIKRPKAVIDLSVIENLRGIKEEQGDLVIGSMTTLTEVSTSELVEKKFPILSAAAGEVASPQIRNRGTIGGNISQDTRCWYYRGGWHCYRAGGNICYAATPEGMNREHAIFGIKRCAAVSPSDTAPVFVALDAKMVVDSAEGRRVIPAHDYFVGPDVDILHLTVLKPGEILTEIRIPSKWSDQPFYFEKIRDRPVWDFPIVNIAATMKMAGNLISDIRLVVGAVAAKPWRLAEMENELRGKSLKDASDSDFDTALKGARNLTHNDYKKVLVKNLVKRAVSGREDS